MSGQEIFAALIVLGAVVFLLRRFRGRETPKPRPGPDVPTRALLRKSRSRPPCSRCDD